MPLTNQGGSLILTNGSLGSGQGCCCPKCSLGDCTATIEFLDENECEDDVFDLYVINPETLAERLVSEVDLVADPPGSCQAEGATYADISIPLELTTADWSSDCRVTIELRFKSANCCFTWTRFRLRRPDDTLLYGTYFSQGGLSVTYTWDDLCGPGEPPPPPRSCCSKIATCGELDIWACSGSEQNCCNDLDPEADCTEVGVMPLIECTFTDQAPAQATAPNQSPFDCLGETHLNYLNGAWVETSGWDVWDATGNDPADFDAATQTLYNHAEGLINSSYFAEWDGCFANADITFTTSGPTVTIGEDTYNTTWETRVILDMCERTVQVSASETSAGLASFTINAELTALAALTPPCNAYSGCYCSSWSAEPFFGGGNVNVGL